MGLGDRDGIRWFGATDFDQDRAHGAIKPMSRPGFKTLH
jgi:hypothetical protein